jgi:hypothetical protein
MPKRVEVPHNELFKRFAENIARDKRQILSVQGTRKEPPFAYTIGNQEKLLPELLLFGNLGATEISSILNDLSEHMIYTKAPWPLGENVWGDYHFYAYDGGCVAKANYTYQAGQFYGNEDYKVLQIVLPDRKGRWPDEELCHKSFKVPILGLTGAPMIHR